jgi:hypothetical protein
MRGPAGFCVVIIDSLCLGRRGLVAVRAGAPLVGRGAACWPGAAIWRTGMDGRTCSAGPRASQPPERNDTFKCGRRRAGSPFLVNLNCNRALASCQRDDPRACWRGPGIVKTRADASAGLDAHGEAGPCGPARGGQPAGGGEDLGCAPRSGTRQGRALAKRRRSEGGASCSAAFGEVADDSGQGLAALRWAQDLVNGGEGLRPLGRHQQERGFARCSPVADRGLADANTCAGRKPQESPHSPRCSRAMK